MAQFTFDLSNKDEAALVIKAITAVHGSSFHAPIVPAPAPAPVAAAPIAAAPVAAAPVSAPVVAVAAPVVAVAAPVAAASTFTDLELQAKVQNAIAVGATKGIGVPQILGVLKELGVNRISELSAEQRGTFVEKVDALVA